MKTVIKIRQIYRERQFMKEYKKAQEKAQIHGIVNDAYDVTGNERNSATSDKKLGSHHSHSQISDNYPRQEYKMNSIHDKNDSVHDADQNELGIALKQPLCLSPMSD